MRDTIELARESLVVPFFLKETNDELLVRLKDFEALVRADEREACAKVCEDVNWEGSWKKAANDRASAIRARGNT